jgi:serine/threonine protein phosphatase 1
MLSRIAGIPLVKRLPVNPVGRDLVATDVHGCFSLLEAAMRRADFDPQKDRLFLVGDMVDRGPESDQVVNWLRRPYVHAVRGNHDQMIIDAGRTGDTEFLEDHGALWFKHLLNRGNYSEIFELVDELTHLPLAIEVADRLGRRYGLVHAECPFPSWTRFTQTLEHETDPDRLHNTIMAALWSRTRIKYRDHSVISDIDEILVGHSVVSAPSTLGNTRYLDTGACYEGGHLTLTDITSGHVWTISFQEIGLSRTWRETVDINPYR